MDKEKKCKRLGEYCYDFTGLWCDECLKRKLKNSYSWNKIKSAINKVITVGPVLNGMQIDDPLERKRFLKEFKKNLDK